MRINHNIAALNTYRQFTTAGTSQAKSMEKLSSGLRINKAGDDAAGLAISEKMRGQIRGLDQASRNAQDSISLIQTSEGALQETHSILQRMRELAVQASNDTNTTSDRDEIQKEVNQLTSEVNRIGNTTEFNTKKLLNGDFEFVAATSGTTKAGSALSSTVTITNTDLAGWTKAGGFGTAGTTNPKASAATATGDINIGAAGAITAGVNNELTLKVDGVQYDITLTDTTTGAQNIVDDLNTQLAGAGSTATASVDGTGKLTIKSGTLGNSGSVEILGGGFASSYMGADVVGDITYEEGKDVGDVWVHGDVGAEVTGGLQFTDGAGGTLAGANQVTVSAAAGMNELTLNIDGTEKTIKLADKVYDGTTAGQKVSNLVADLQAAIDNAGTGFGAGKATVSIDSSNKLVITSVNTTGTSSVEVLGGGLADKLFGATNTRTEQARQAANNTLTFNVDGASQTVNITDKVYQDVNDFVATNAGAFATKGITISNDSGSLKFASATTGAASDVAGFTASDLTKQLGLFDSAGTATGTHQAGNNGNTTLSITVDGESVNAVLQEGVYNDRKLLAAALQSAINSATSTAADVTVNVNDENKLEITSGSTGSTSGITIGSFASKEAKAYLGLSTSTAVAGDNQKKAELTFQIGANENQSMSLSIKDMRASALGITGSGSGYTNTADVTNGTNNLGVEKALDVTTAQNAANAITVIQTALEKVSGERSKLGAHQNRLEHTINNLGTASENLTAAESRVRDVDMAKEMMEQTKNSILSQAAQAMLAQANQAPQGVLQLLR